MADSNASDTAAEAVAAYVGLAPFLRLSIAGVDLLPVGQALLAAAQQAADDADLMMNLATAMLCLGQRQMGLQVQAQALDTRRSYHLSAVRQPAQLRLLVLVVPGDLSANVPIDCLLEDGDVDLEYCFVADDGTLPSPLPEHDAVLVGISVADRWRGVLETLERTLAQWPKPVINAPARIPATDRNTASVLLQGVPGLLMPPTLRARRVDLEAVAAGAASLPQRFEGCEFPAILRPLASHGGHGLERIASPEDLGNYLAGRADDTFFLSPFVDYSGTDGRFRKFRIALVDGEPFACHMAVSSHWMVHYVNADMYRNADRRAEEAGFLEGFADFARRHGAALHGIHARVGLDYLQIDCAELPDGRLLIFEIDHAMVVHAMDPEEMFPYKQPVMHKVQMAFRDLLARRVAAAVGPCA